jgi:hypothetical protein
VVLEPSLRRVFPYAFTTRVEEQADRNLLPNITVFIAITMTSGRIEGDATVQLLNPDRANAAQGELGLVRIGG